MTTLTWPSDVLPSAFLREGFQYQRKPAVVRTEMESSAARARLVDRNPLAQVPVSCRMDSEQVDFFKAWVESYAAYGGAWFYIDLPLSFDEQRTVLARFTDEAVIVPFGAASWRVSFTLEIRDPNVVSADVLGLVRAFGRTGTQDMAAALDGVTLQPWFVDYEAEFSA